MRPNKKHKEYILYCLYTVDDGKVFYIGITSYPISYRLKEHIRDAFKIKDKKFLRKHKNANKIRKLVNSNVKFDIMKILSSNEESEISNLEEKYISWAKNIGFKLTNFQTGGYGNFKLSNESCKKISLKLKEKFKNGEMSNSGDNNPMFGKKHSKYTKDKIGLKSFGRKWSDEKRKRKSESMIGRKNPKTSETLRRLGRWIGKNNPSARSVNKIDIHTKKVIFTYETITQAAKDISRSVKSLSDCLAGKRKSCGGFFWEYLK